MHCYTPDIVSKTMLNFHTFGELDSYVPHSSLIHRSRGHQLEIVADQRPSPSSAREENGAIRSQMDEAV